MKRLITLVVFALGLCYQGLYAQNEKGYDPDIFALESGRGQLAKEYFGVKLSDVEKDAKGKYLLTEAQRDTIKTHILGDHLCSLQWISWKEFGKVSFTEGPNGKVYCKGGQTGGEDYLKIDGYVTIISPLHITISGTITTKVSYINGGKPVVRKGKYNFTIAGARRYWRMREMKNPAPDGPTDYVDIYF